MPSSRRRSKLKPAPPPPLVPVTTLAELPLVLTMIEIARVYRISVATIRRKVQAGTFLPRPHDEYPYRWLKSDVERDLARRREPHKKRAHGFAARRLVDAPAAT